MLKTTIVLLAAAALTACAGPGRKAATRAEAKPDTEQQDEKALYGGYTRQRPLSDEERELFREVTASLRGVRYTPESVATQVVAGMNYRFVCTAATATRRPETYRAEITVFRPLPGRGEATITGIKRL